MEIRKAKKKTYQNDTDQASLHLLKEDAVLRADNLLLHGDGLLKTSQNVVRKAGNGRKAIVGRVHDE
jgi:predicted O-methyltransferase YrrM